MNLTKYEIQIQNEELTDAVYAVPWYLMPPKHAMLVTHALNRLQNGGIIRMGPFAPLNYETASNVCMNHNHNA